MEKQYKVVHYKENAKDIFQNWLDSLRDLRAKTTIARAVKRMENGNFGVHRFCRDAVWELVFDIGPGYRVYYSMIDNVVVILLCAGDKSTQQKDINKAIKYLQDFRKENLHYGHQ